MALQVVPFQAEVTIFSHADFPAAAAGVDTSGTATAIVDRTSSARRRYELYFLLIFPRPGSGIETYLTK
ncbi:MAG: hypothetical protein DRN54_04380 [Thaumarchaeota archaeon]|nr:MAG: hypothetical protein DRN54_04380 [Nitrososphaerota archaeon]